MTFFLHKISVFFKKKKPCTILSVFLFFLMKNSSFLCLNDTNPNIFLVDLNIKLSSVIIMPIRLEQVCLVLKILVGVCLVVAWGVAVWVCTSDPLYLFLLYFFLASALCATAFLCNSLIC